MPRNGSGTYTPPGGTAAVSLATISSTAFNSLIADIGQEITNSLPTTGVKAMGADLPMGGYKVTNLGTPSATTDAATKAYVDAAAGGAVVVSAWIGGTSGGTANAQTLTTLTPTTPAYTHTAGNRIVFIPGFTNAGATTLTPLALAGKNVFKVTTAGPVALSGGEIVAGQLTEVIYDGTQFIITDQPPVVASFTTAAQYWANSANATALSPDQVWAGGAVQTLTDGATVTPNFNSGFNFTWTIGGNRTLASPTNGKPGESGFIRIIQDGTGSRTITWGANWLFDNAVEPSLSTAPAAEDVLFYTVVTSTRIVATLFRSVG